MLQNDYERNNNKTEREKQWKLVGIKNAFLLILKSNGQKIAEGTEKGKSGMEERVKREAEKKEYYNRAAGWQLAFFPLNNTATNCFMFLMSYVTYLAVGGIGAGMIFVSSMMTWMRIFDAVTDPVIGVVIDRMKTKYGKFRPIIVAGYFIMLVSLWCMYFLAVRADEGMKIPVFVCSYFFYIIGYTLQTACTKAGQTCITNDPVQRPLFTRYDAIYTLILFSLGSVYISGYLQPKHGEINVAAMQEFCLTFMVISAVFTACAVAALWEKDVEKNWGAGAREKIRFKDYIAVFKGNRPLQMLVLAASTDKLAFTCSTNAGITMLLFGVVIGDYTVSGTLSLVSILPTIGIILAGTKLAGKQGSKAALVRYTWYSILSAVVLFLVFWLTDPQKIRFGRGGSLIVTGIFLAVYCIHNGVKSIVTNIVIPMIADCSDYETYKTGRYVPGMLGTLFSFVDKAVSSFGNTVAGLFLAGLGYVHATPQAGDPYSVKVFIYVMAAFIGLPILGWIASLIAMRYYILDDEKMREIGEKLAGNKQE